MGPKSEHVEKPQVFVCYFERAGGAFSGGKRSGAGPKKKPLKRNSFGAVDKIMLPSEGREACFQEFGFMSYGNTAKLEGSMEKS